MDASELIDFRSSNTPIALWRNMVVSSLHHDGTDVPADWETATEPIIYETLCVLTAALSPVRTGNSDCWIVRDWTGTAPV